MPKIEQEFFDNSVTRPKLDAFHEWWERHEPAKAIDFHSPKQDRRNSQEQLSRHQNNRPLPDHYKNSPPNIASGGSSFGGSSFSGSSIGLHSPNVPRHSPLAEKKMTEQPSACPLVVDVAHMPCMHRPLSLPAISLAGARNELNASLHAAASTSAPGRERARMHQLIAISGCCDTNVHLHIAASEAEKTTSDDVEIFLEASLATTCHIDSAAHATRRNTLARKPLATSPESTTSRNRSIWSH